MEKIKIGIFGLGRGGDYIDSILLNGFEIVAGCDRNESKWPGIKEKIPGIALYNDPEEFAGHPMDAVFLANFFNEHDEWAVKFLDKGVHVLSECASNGTMAGGVELVRAAERSSAVYMLAENYPFMIFNREMKRVYETGTLGKALFAEGEYNHPFDVDNADAVRGLRPFPTHWRNYLPRSYYITHSLAPLMYITGAFPKRVTAFPVYDPLGTDNSPIGNYVADRAAIITTLNDDGSVFRVTGCAAFGAHENSYRICAENGQIENLRGMGDKVMLRYSDWCVPEGMSEVNFYEPQASDMDAETLKRFGHGGSDYFVMKYFREALEKGKKPVFDVYFATTLASVAILSHRSILEGGRPFDVPDLSDENVRKLYENDFLTPFYGKNGEKPTLPCCSEPGYAPTERQLKRYYEVINRNDNI